MEARRTELRGTSRDRHTIVRHTRTDRVRRGRRGRASVAVMMAIAVIMGFLGVAGPAAADDLVSNLGQLSLNGGNDERLAFHEFAQAFTTGTNVSGYRLESISIDFEQGGNNAAVGDPIYVYLHEDNGNNRPNHNQGGQVAVLTKSGVNYETAVAGVNKYFTSLANGHCCPRPPAVHLNPNTK